MTNSSTSRSRFLVEVDYDHDEEAFIYQTSYDLPFSRQLNVQEELNKVEDVQPETARFFSSNRVRVKLRTQGPATHAAAIKAIAFGVGMNALHLHLHRVRFVYMGSLKSVSYDTLEEHSLPAGH